MKGAPTPSDFQFSIKRKENQGGMRTFSQRKKKRKNQFYQNIFFFILRKI